MAVMAVVVVVVVVVLLRCLDCGLSGDDGVLERGTRLNAVWVDVRRGREIEGYLLSVVNACYGLEQLLLADDTAQFLRRCWHAKGRKVSKKTLRSSGKQMRDATMVYL